MKNTSGMAVNSLAAELIIALKREIAQEVLEMQEYEGAQNRCKLASHGVALPLLSASHAEIGLI